MQVDEEATFTFTSDRINILYYCFGICATGSFIRQLIDSGNIKLNHKYSDVMEIYIYVKADSLITFGSL